MEIHGMSLNILLSALLYLFHYHICFTLGNLDGMMAKVLDCGVEVSKFDLLDYYP